MAVLQSKSELLHAIDESCVQPVADLARTLLARAREGSMPGQGDFQMAVGSNQAAQFDHSGNLTRRRVWKHVVRA